MGQGGRSSGEKGPQQGKSRGPVNDRHGPSYSRQDGPATSQSNASAPALAGGELDDENVEVWDEEVLSEEEEHALFMDLCREVAERMRPAQSPPVVGVYEAGRNDPCPCGSGKKFKRCHGKSD